MLINLTKASVEELAQAVFGHPADGDVPAPPARRPMVSLDAKEYA